MGGGQGSVALTRRKSHGGANLTNEQLSSFYGKNYLEDLFLTTV